MPDTTFPVSAPLTSDGFCRWLGHAFPGDRIEYHRGFLGCDRDPENRSRPAAERRRIDALAEQARDLAAAGLIGLIQHRYGDADYGYLAFKMRRRAA